MWQAASPGHGRFALAGAGESYVALGLSWTQPVRLSWCE